MGQMQNVLKSYWLIFMFVIAAFTFAVGIDLYKDIEAMHWPTSTGYLSKTYSQDQYRYSQPKYGPIFEPLRTPKLVFSYEVNGKSYTSSNVSFGMTLSDAIELTGKKDDGGFMVKVYFNPSNPEEAVLIPGPKIISIALVAIGCLTFSMILRRAIRDKVDTKMPMDRCNYP